MNHASQSEAESIVGLLTYLNDNTASERNNGVDYEVAMGDSNGESLGTLKWNSQSGYVWEFPPDED